MGYMLVIAHPMGYAPLVSYQPRSDPVKTPSGRLLLGSMIPFRFLYCRILLSHFF